MIFIGTYDIPEWSINYLKGIDKDLSKDEIQLIEHFKNKLIKKYNTDEIIFDYSLIGNKNLLIKNNFYAAFGKVADTWKIPVWIKNNNYTFQQFNIVITGYKNKRYQIIIFNNYSFISEKEARNWINAYYSDLEKIDIKIYKSEKSNVIIFNQNEI